MSNVDPSIFKAYDIRGTYPNQLNEDIAKGVAKGIVSILKPSQLVLGRDCRTSGPSLHQVVLETLLDVGVEVIDIGLVSSDMYYYACATRKLPGIMITASHNPKEYNGFKMVRQIPYFLTGDDEIMKIKDMIVTNQFPGYTNNKQGKHTQVNIMEEFVTYLTGLVPTKNFKPFKIVADTANGMVGPIIEALKPKLNNIEIVAMYFEPDGTFPNHGGDPLQEENRHDITAKIKETGADLGVMFDPDGDRFFVLDKKCRFIPGDFMTAILSEYFLHKKPGANIVYDIRASKVVPETITKNSGKPFYNRVGHSYIKKRMIDEAAVFGGEVTGHYYFADFFYCDTGIVTMLYLLDYFSHSPKSLDQIVDEMLQRYFISGEINSQVTSVPDTLAKIESHYQTTATEILKVDGVSAEFNDWRFNVRGSNTEPLIRLNLEAKNHQLMEQKRDEILAMIRS